MDKLNRLYQLPGTALVDMKTVALLRGVHPKTVARWVREGRIATPVTGPCVRPRWRLDTVR